MSMTTAKNLSTEIDSKVIIAIDPDVEKSGVCYYNVASGMVEAASIDFPSLIDYLRYISEKKAENPSASVRIVVEAGWLNKSHWHGAYQYGARVSAMMGNKTGRNQETGRKIVECAKHYGLDVVEQKPLTKVWKGKDGKITQEELDMIMRGLNLSPIIGRINQDCRDAALIAVVYSQRCF